MKILGAGRLVDRIDDALPYALASPVIDCFAIGSESKAQLQDPLARIPKASMRG